MNETNKCKFCGRAEEGNAGDYYHEKDCERRDVLRRMNEAETRGYKPGERERLERALFRASYTGD